MTIYSTNKVIVLMITAALLSPLILFSCYEKVNAQGPVIQIGMDIDGEAANDYSGASVSLNTAGDIVAIGAYGNEGNGEFAGHVRIYQNQSGTWSQIGADIDGEAVGDYFGYSVSLNAAGDIVAIGAIGNDGADTDAGHVQIYKYESDIDTWTQIGADIDGEAADDESGHSVSLNAAGDIVAIGTPHNDGNKGHVQIYQYQSVTATWTQIGADIDGEAALDFSGQLVSLNTAGDIVAIGARYNNGNGTDAGHVRIYQNQSGTWIQIGDDIDGEAAGDLSGASVSLNAVGDIVAIGADENDGNGSQAGHVRVYQNIADTWIQIGDDIDGEAAGDESGWTVSLNAAGNIVAIGARYNNGNGTDAGHVRIYQNQSGTWTQIGTDIDGEAADDLSGHSVSLNSAGDIVAIGAIHNDGNGYAAGHVRMFALPSPEMVVLGNSTPIATGDTSPNAADDTDFGSLIVGDSPIIHAFTISNSGTEDLTLSGSSAVTLTGGTHFNVSAQPYSTTVISNSTTTFEVTFNPSVGGNFTDTVNIANNDSDENPYTFVILGKADDFIFTYIPIIFKDGGP